MDHGYTLQPMANGIKKGKNNVWDLWKVRRKRLGVNRHSRGQRRISELKERINYLEEINRSQNKQLENYQVLLLNEQNRNNLIEEVEAKPTLWDRLKERFKQ